MTPAVCGVHKQGVVIDASGATVVEIIAHAARFQERASAVDEGSRHDSGSAGEGGLKPPVGPAAPIPNPLPGGDAARRAQFESLALPLLDRLYAMALHLVRDPAKAEDMVQETYLRAWQNFDRFQIGTHFKAWIFQIMTYLFLNERRSAQRREASVDFSEHDVLEAPPAPDAGQVQAPETNWDELYPDLVDDALKRALDHLGPEQRTVFLLVTLGELSYQECADILKVPIGTVMSRLFRARKQLQDELGRYAQDRGLLRSGDAP